MCELTVGDSVTWLGYGAVRCGTVMRVEEDGTGVLLDYGQEVPWQARNVNGDWLAYAGSKQGFVLPVLKIEAPT